MSHHNLTLYQVIGADKLHALVDEFYSRVKQDPLLAPIFPEDLTETARKQKQFLTQFLGGPNLYTQEHGHPQLRFRHLRFPITRKHAEAWLHNMYNAMKATGLDEEIREQIFARLTLTAYHMVNTESNEQELDEKVNFSDKSKYVQ